MTTPFSGVYNGTILDIPNEEYEDITEIISFYMYMFVIAWRLVKPFAANRRENSFLASGATMIHAAILLQLKMKIGQRLMIELDEQWYLITDRENGYQASRLAKFGTGLIVMPLMMWFGIRYLLRH